MDNRSFEGFGFVIAILLLAGVPAFVFALNVFAWRQRTANRMCLLSVLLLIGTYFYTLIVAAISHRLQFTPEVAATRRLAAYSLWILLLASAVVAIIGICQVRRHHRRRRPGEHRAWMVLLCDVALVALIIWALGAAERREKLAKDAAALAAPASSESTSPDPPPP